MIFDSTAFVHEILRPEAQIAEQATFEELMEQK